MPALPFPVDAQLADLLVAREVTPEAVKAGEDHPLAVRPAKRVAVGAVHADPRLRLGACVVDRSLLELEVLSRGVWHCRDVWPAGR